MLASLKPGSRVEYRDGDYGLVRTSLMERAGGGWRIEGRFGGSRVIADEQITRKIVSQVERNVGPTTYYSELDSDGTYVHSLHHRQVQALVACRAGLGRIRLRRFQSPYFCDYHLEPECDVYGIGYGTLSELQRWGYLQESKEEGPLALTPKGERVLDEILELEGSNLPPLVTEAVPA